MTDGDNLPATYSLDLRKRVSAAVVAGKGTPSQIATCFVVSLGWVEKLLRQRRRAGHLGPVGHHGGAVRRVDEHALEATRAAVTAQPDLALEELRLRLHRQARVRMSVSTLWRWIEALDSPRKKDVRYPRGGSRRAKRPPRSDRQPRHRRAAVDLFG